MSAAVRVADPHHFSAVPDPAFHLNADPDLDPVFRFNSDRYLSSFHFNADPDPAFHFNADPDHAPRQSDGNRRPLAYRRSRAPF